MSAVSPPSPTSPLEARHLAVLVDRMGLGVEIAEHGFLLVDVTGHQCFVLLDHDDPSFVRLGTTQPWPADAPRSWVAAAAEHVNRRCPGVKATLSDDHGVVVLSAEMVVGPDGGLPDEALLAAVVHRMTQALVDAVQVLGDDLVLRSLDADPVTTAPGRPDRR